LSWAGGAESDSFALLLAVDPHDELGTQWFCHPVAAGSARPFDIQFAVRGHRVRLGLITVAPVDRKSIFQFVRDFDRGVVDRSVTLGIRELTWCFAEIPPIRTVPC